MPSKALVFSFDIHIPISSGKKLPNVETSEKLSEMFNTNNRYIKDVARIKQEDPEALDDIRSGSKTISEYKKEEKTKQRIKDIEEKLYLAESWKKNIGNFRKRKYTYGRKKKKVSFTKVMIGYFRG
jgi:hypothetical protein